MKKKRTEEEIQAYSQRAWKLRKALGYPTQVAFAKVLGVDKQVVSMAERGVRLYSKYVQLLLVAKYNVSLEWLNIGEGSIFTSPMAQIPHEEENGELETTIEALKRSFKSLVLTLNIMKSTIETMSLEVDYVVMEHQNKRQLQGR